MHFQLPQINFTKYNVDISLDDDETEKKSENNDLTVRGRVFDQTKPETFNQVRIQFVICQYQFATTRYFSALDM